MVKPLLIIAILAVFLGSCSVQQTVVELGPNEVKLHGKVEDLQGVPLPNSYVQVSDENYVKLQAARTNKKGEYEFILPRYSTYKVWVGSYSNILNTMFSHIPETKTLKPGAVSELEADFNLMPGANIVIHAYDESGNLIRNKRFREITDSRVFVTEMPDKSCVSSLCAICDEYSNWEWNQAIPAIVVTPGILNMVHVQWEIPEFGKVMLLLDNEGKGYYTGEPGGVLAINLNYEAAKSKLAAIQRDYDLFKEQGYEVSNTVDSDIELGKEHLKIASDYLSRPIFPHIRDAIGELNLSLKYTSQAHEQLYLDKATADIEKYRKGIARIEILDSGNKQMADYTLQIKQTSSDFQFGANPMGPAGGYDKQYVKLMKDMGINYANITPRWGRIEPEKGVFDWENIDGYQNISGLVDDGFQLIGSLSMWFYRSGQVGYDFCPLYQDGMTIEELKENVFNHMYALASRYRGKIDVWEINEINLPYANVLKLTTEQKLQICDVFVKAVKMANPEAKILVSSVASPYEFNVAQVEDSKDKLDYVSFPEFLDLLIQRDIPVDIIGLEFYYSGVNNDGNASVSLDLVGISDILDQYMCFGKPILVSEFSAPSVQAPGSAWWHRPWDEETQAEYVEEFYTIAFSKPLVHGITWSWGICDSDAFIVSGGLLDDSLNPKPAYFALKNLLSSWTTSGSGKTINAGEYNLTGFGGEYQVIIKDTDGYSFSTNIHVTEQKTSLFTIRVE